VAHCVGRGEAAPLRPGDVTALASTLAMRTFPPGSALFRGGEQTSGVWIVREGRIELSVSSGRRRAVVQLPRPGHVDGDIRLLLEVALPYTGRTANEVTCLFLAPTRCTSGRNRQPRSSGAWVPEGTYVICHQPVTYGKQRICVRAGGGRLARRPLAFAFGSVQLLPRR